MQWNPIARWSGASLQCLIEEMKALENIVTKEVTKMTRLKKMVKLAVKKGSNIMAHFKCGR